MLLSRVEQYMDMIFGTAHDDKWNVHIAHCAGHEAVHAIPYGLIKKAYSVLGAEY